MGVRLGRGKCWRAQKSLNERAPGTRLPTCPQPSPFPPTRCQDLCGLRKSLECTFISISDFRNPCSFYQQSCTVLYTVQYCIQYGETGLYSPSLLSLLSCLSCTGLYSPVQRVGPVQSCTYSPVRRYSVHISRFVTYQSPCYSLETSPLALGFACGAGSSLARQSSKAALVIDRVDGAHVTSPPSQSASPSHFDVVKLFQ